MRKKIANFSQSYHKINAGRSLPTRAVQPARDAARKGACGVLADVRTLTGLQRDAEGAEGGVGEEGY